jgi:DNA-binding PadR family transcriptional regulator
MCPPGLLTADASRYIVRSIVIFDQSEIGMSSHDFAARGPLHFGWAMARGKGGHGRHPRPDDLERMGALRHVVGGGHFGGGPMFDRPFGGGRGRKRRGDVRTALLLLLAEEPRNGYQLMQTIEERSDGRWRPSPGSVYPTLAQLEDEGLIRPAEIDGQKVFEITEAGRARLAEREDAPAPWEHGDEADEDSHRQLRSLIGALAAAAMQVQQAGDEQQIQQARELLSEARRGLYRILAEDTDE